jgi:hypothetical protein
LLFFVLNYYLEYFNFWLGALLNLVSIVDNQVVEHLKFTFGFGTHRHVVIDELAPGRQVDGDCVIVKAHILVGEGRHESSCWQFGATG